MTDIGTVHSVAREYVPGVNFCIGCRLKLNMESMLTKNVYVNEMK